ncbi:200 kDa antigen p200 [Trypanosoma grayi]|uniref:200 kDa antigen p200 n=1 Tax=Trypanosoma grayi TaxID=71804 RepID=UPI0004F4A964|nr:200 kDa antigen p200 [Trypanosoma grayi]KEG15151.1 200 kDa antigen p200 [Trypanosoma grayi]
MQDTHRGSAGIYAPPPPVSAPTSVTEAVVAQLPPLAQPPPPRSPTTSSPAKRSVTASSVAVIRSPMAMNTLQTCGSAVGSSPVGAVTAANGAMEDASPLSTTTAAAEYAEIEQKQIELRSVVEHRILTLECSLQRREEELEVLRAQLRKTEEDYQFNYDLIKDRDAALEEAATQLQSLYDELKRLKSEEAATTKRLEGLEQETHQLRQRLRETEVRREEAVQKVQQAYQLKERQLKDAITHKDTALEAEKQRLHEEYLRRFKTLDDARVEVTQKSEALAVELEDKWKQQLQRMEEKLSASLETIDAVQREKMACEGRCVEVTQALSLLKHEHETLQQRYDAAVAELAEKQCKFEAKLNECSAIMGQGIATAEDSIRQHTQRANKLEIECGQLQSQVTDLQERLQAARLQRDEDAKRFLEESRETQERYRQAASQVEEQRRTWIETELQLSQRVQKVQSELEAAQQDNSALLSRVSEWQKLHESSERRRVQCEQELERGRRELQRCSEEEQRTAAHAQELQRVADEKLHAAGRDAEDAREEAERVRRQQRDAQERSQAEMARLTRELHASEAARRALEEHYHLAEDVNGQRGLIDALRRDKEALEKKALELERTNAAIREQVASFTMELQNDPVVKSAKETQRRVQELQEDLLRARDDNQRLQDALREKEEETSRYQLEILRARSTETAALHQRDREDQRLRQEYQNAKEAYERMRQSLKEQQYQQQQRRRAPSGKPEEGDEGSDSDKGEAKSHRRGGKRPGDGPEKDMVLLREAELWRRKYLQLEQSVRDLLRERDSLTKELHLTRQDVDALTSEKQSLVDLNSLLKAQLREAYRTALEYPQQQHQQQQQQQQQNQQQLQPAVFPQHLDLATVSSRATVAAAAGESSQSAPQLAVDAVLSSGSAAAAKRAAGGGATQKLSADAERLAVLEEELAAMKAHMVAQRPGAVRPMRHGIPSTAVSTTTATAAVGAGRGSTRKSLKERPQQQEQQQQQASTCASMSRSLSRSGVPLVQRGSTAVRHYGYL